jgi:hypothetical protein
MPKNILICTGGESPWVFPENYDFLARAAYADSFPKETAQERTQLLKREGFLDDLNLWIITTEEALTTLKEDLLAWVKLDQLQGKVCFFAAPGTRKLGNYSENNIMLEAILRVTVKAKETVAPDGKVYLGIAGGRKTMSIYLQQTDMFFGADGVFHIIADEPEIGKITRAPENDIKKLASPEKLAEIKRRIYPHVFPSCLLSSLEWSKTISGSVTYAMGGMPIRSQDFPIEPVNLAKLPVALPSLTSAFVGAPVSQIHHAIKKAEEVSKRFVDMLLGAGAGTATLYHDLCSNGQIKSAVIPILPAYLDGINMIANSGKICHFLQDLSVPNLVEQLIKPALIIAGYDVVEQGPGVYQLQCAAKSCLLRYQVKPCFFKKPSGLLLILLRNLLKNAVEHGTGGEIQLTIGPTEKGGCRLAVTNSLTADDIGKQSWKRVGIPFASSKRDGIHGLGGTAAHKAADLLDGELQPDPDVAKQTITFWVEIPAPEVVHGLI